MKTRRSASSANKDHPSRGSDLPRLKEWSAQQRPRCPVLDYRAPRPAAGTDDALRRSAAGRRRWIGIGRRGPVSGGRQRNCDADQRRAGNDEHAVATVQKLGLAHASRFSRVQWCRIGGKHRGCRQRNNQYRDYKPSHTAPNAHPKSERRGLRKAFHPCADKIVVSCESSIHFFLRRPQSVMRGQFDA